MKDQSFETPVLGIVAAYFFLFLLVLWPVTDFLTTALPPQWGRVEWRYASAGLMGSYLVTPLMGIVFSMALATVLKHWNGLRFLSVVCLFGALFLIMAMISLALDTIQLWKIQPPEGLPSLRRGGIIGELKHLSGVVTLILFGVTGWKVSGRGSATESVKEKPVVRPPGPALKSEKG